MARATGTRRRAGRRARNRVCPCPLRPPSNKSSGSAIQVRAWTPFVTEQIGASSIGRPGQRPCHISRDTSPCSSDTPFAWDDVRSANGVSPNPSSPSWTRPSAANSSHVKPQRETTEPTFCSTIAASKNFVAGRHRGVRGEHRRGAKPLQRLVASDVLVLDELRAGARAGGTRSGPSFMWKTVGSLPSARRDAHASETEDELLPQAMQAIAPVELVRDRPAPNPDCRRRPCRADTAAGARPARARHEPRPVRACRTRLRAPRPRSPARHSREGASDRSAGSAPPAGRRRSGAGGSSPRGRRGPTPTSGTPRSDADLRWSPASTPSPPE